MRFTRGDTALFYEMVSVLRPPSLVRPVIVLNVLLMADMIRYNVLCGIDKLIATDDELFEDDAGIERERQRRKKLDELFDRLARK